jgi:sterol desaturase/sphingolipid hydroxylase (fatty acid hydroxylase superfamily)
MKRSIFAVVAGYASTMLAIVLCTTLATRIFIQQPSATSTALPSEPSTLPTSLLVTRALCTGVFALMGGWLTARLAPKAAMLHSVATAAAFIMISFVTALFGAANASAEFVAQPSWYPFVLALLGTAAILLGGFMAEQQTLAG